MTNKKKTIWRVFIPFFLKLLLEENLSIILLGKIITIIRILCRCILTHYSCVVYIVRRSVILYRSLGTFIDVVRLFPFIECNWHMQYVSLSKLRRQMDDKRDCYLPCTQRCRDVVHKRMHLRLNPISWILRALVTLVGKRKKGRKGGQRERERAIVSPWHLRRPSIIAFMVCAAINVTHVVA